MNAALQVKPEIAEKIQRLATARNISVDQLLSDCIQTIALEESSVLADQREDLLSELDKWIADFSTEAPPLSDESVSRSSIYRELA